ncbi:FAD binding domain-containing protein [Chloroflexota bacterium]
MIKDFEYLRPKTLEEALKLLSQYKDECKVIAGGQSLIILMKQKLVTPQYLIDIKGISALDYIKFDPNNGLRVGALTTHRAIEKSPLFQNGLSILSEMEHRLASVGIREWGTIGGNLCHADPIGDPAPVLIVLNGQLKMASLRGERTMPVEEFAQDYFNNALESDELFTEIQVPKPFPRTGVAYTKFNLVEGDQAIVAAAVSITLSSKNGKCENARIALGGAAPTPLRVQKAEQVLAGQEITDKLIEEAARVASGETSPISDIHASEAFKRELTDVMVRRVAKEALTRAKKT